MTLYHFPIGRNGLIQVLFKACRIVLLNERLLFTEWGFTVTFSWGRFFDTLKCSFR